METIQSDELLLLQTKPKPKPKLKFKLTLKKIPSDDPRTKHKFKLILKKIPVDESKIKIKLTLKTKIVIKLKDQYPPSSNYPLEKEEHYLRQFLENLKSSSQKGKEKECVHYKRFTISPLRYAGGKSQAVGLILEHLPKLTHKRIVSPFFGGGSVELCLSQMLGFEVIGYDIFEMLTNFWNVLIHQKDQFLTELKKLIVSPEEFTKNRHILLSYWDHVKPPDLIYRTQKKVDLTETEKTLLWDDRVLQAVYYYYNMSLCYGPMFLGWPSKVEIDALKFKRRLEKLTNVNLVNLSVQCLDFKESIPKHIDDFLFLDPPYYLGPDSTMFKGMYPNTNFAIHHNNFDHELLRDLLRNHRGGFLMTYNDCPTLREWYKDYHQVFPEWQYTYGQGEIRISINRLSGDGTYIKQSHEMFIICPSKI